MRNAKRSYDKNIDSQGVYELQGGINKYFKVFPEGGYLSGTVLTKDLTHPKNDSWLPAFI